MKFVQIIEFRTSRIDEFNAALDEWLDKTDRQRRIVTRATQTRDRDNDGIYVHIVEFPSYEEAMENSNRSETGEFAAQLAALCDGPAVFRNLDVLRVDDLS
jgi:quinol monooxygenase YgiN